MRMTNALVDVAYALVTTPDDRHWGYELWDETGVRSGVLYPILKRMLDEGWLEDGWESHEEASSAGRPPRRYYTLTPLGIAELGGVVSKAQQDKRFALRPARGW